MALFYGQLHVSALLHVCPTALCHSAAPSSLQASPMQERGLWLQVQADAGVSPAGCSPAAAEGPTECGQEAEHSYASSEGKERRNLGWVRTEGIYQYREFFTYYLLSHTHTHARTRQPGIFLQAQKGHQSIIHPSGFPGSLKQTEVTFKRTPSCSTHRMLCPWVGAGQAPESPQERWDFRRFLRPALAPRWAPFIRPLNWPCIFARFLEGARSRSWVGAGTEHTKRTEMLLQTPQGMAQQMTGSSQTHQKTLTKSKIKPLPTPVPFLVSLTFC